MCDLTKIGRYVCCMQIAVVGLPDEEQAEKIVDFQINCTEEYSFNQSAYQVSIAATKQCDSDSGD